MCEKSECWNCGSEIDQEHGSYGVIKILGMKKFLCSGGLFNCFHRLSPEHTVVMTPEEVTKRQGEGAMRKIVKKSFGDIPGAL